MSLSRLDRALKEIKVRFARNSEGMIIAQMVHCSHDAVPNVTWDAVYPHWILALKDGEAIGCIQVCYSVPIGRMEFLSFIPGLNYRTRALAVKALLNLGAITLKQAGAQAVAGCIGFDQKSFKEILKSEGCVIAMSGNTMIKKVA